MLKYASVGISELEIPTKKSLVIYISNCQNKCPNCHTIYLNEDYGEFLSDNFDYIIELYYNYFDVVCFMGEGQNISDTHDELRHYCKKIHNNSRLAALYCGRNCNIEDWMEDFDYIKIGSYIESKGPLSKPTTNQRLYKKDGKAYQDITYLFWH